MERHLRARHARTWLILGPLLLAALIALLVARPRVEPVSNNPINVDPSSGAAP